MSRYVITALLVVPLAAWGQGSLEDRVSRLERMVSSGTLMDLLARVESLQQEVRELRGRLEEQDHRLDRLRERQKELYVDVDRRLQRMEAGRGEAAPAAPEAPAEPPPPATAAPPAAAAPPADPLEEQAAYEAAFNLLRDGRYERAGDAFGRFVQRYPTSGYADNALYWLGESHYVTRDFDAARQAFQRVVDEHPQSDKFTHALLKIGYIHHEQGNLDAAEQVLTILVDDHPQSTAARLARERLKRVRADRG
ncbi:MAG: tol-pal system protein YbgF [Myxococcota bacterium]|nr:tol-pal system protein YbgF [Myxococcota bacterium]